MKWGHKAAWPEFEVDLSSWIQKRINIGLAILPSLIQLGREVQHTAVLAGEFKAGNNWCQWFLKRNGLSIQEKMTLAQRLPADYEEKIVNFHSYVIKHRKQHGYSQTWMKHHLLYIRQASKSHHKQSQRENCKDQDHRELLLKGNSDLSCDRHTQNNLYINTDCQTGLLVLQPYCWSLTD